MSWRIAIAHTTSHRYAREVSASYNEARVVPLTLPRQICLEARVEVSPAARTYRYWDYWGSAVTVFDLHVPHTELVVQGTSVVETSAPADQVGDLTWRDLSTEDVLDRFAELLVPTSYASQGHGQLAAVIEDLRGAAAPTEAAMNAAGWVRDRLRYQPGATDVHTSALQALEQGEGVCQDFVHLTLTLLRALGIPARYVSGYLHPQPEAVIGEPVKGQSHAWLEWWCGEWQPWDPTHGIPVGEGHVVVARGRDYADVPPLKGIYQGAPALAHTVEVELTRTG
jgi:transglutaminase-like putative cysteine protease